MAVISVKKEGWDMSNIYIAFVDTPGFFASIIRRVIKQRYIHVAIGLDERDGGGVQYW